MKKIIYFLATGALLASCAKKKEAVESVEAEGVTEEQVVFEDVDTKEEKEELLHFEAFTIKDDSGMSGFSVDKKGEVVVDGSVVGTIDKYGSLKNVDGEIIVAVNEDGTFYLIGEDSIKKLITVNEDGSGKNHEGKEVKWDESGELLFDGKATGLKMVPAQPSAYKVASILVFLYFNANEV